MSSLVFVYGTLKRGLSNHSWLKGQRFLGEAITEPDYQLFDLGGYPGLVKAAGGRGCGRAVSGEVWEVSPTALQGLHLLEGVAEGEYAFVPVALEPPWADRGVYGYLFLRSVEACEDCGEVWLG